MLLFSLAFMSLLATSFAHLASAADNECANLPPSSVSVSLLESPIQTNYQRSTLALKSMSDRYADPHTAVLGLTQGKAFASTKVGTRLLRDPTGRWECATHQVSIEIGHQPITIYVGREFPEGSCAFKEVHAHEMRHAKIYLDHARNILPEIETALRQRFLGNDPVRGPAGSTQERIQKELTDRWLPYIKRLLSEAESQQREVDTPGEYARVSNACNGEIKAIMAKIKP